MNVILVHKKTAPTRGEADDTPFRSVTCTYRAFYQMQQEVNVPLHEVAPGVAGAALSKTSTEERRNRYAPLALGIIDAIHKRFAEDVNTVAIVGNIISVNWSTPIHNGVVATTNFIQDIVNKAMQN